MYGRALESEAAAAEADALSPRLPSLCYKRVRAVVQAIASVHLELGKKAALTAQAQAWVLGNLANGRTAYQGAPMDTARNGQAYQGPRVACPKFDAQALSQALRTVAVAGLQLSMSLPEMLADPSEVQRRMLGTEPVPVPESVRQQMAAAERQVQLLCPPRPEPAAVGGAAKRPRIDAEQSPGAVEGRGALGVPPGAEEESEEEEKKGEEERAVQLEPVQLEQCRDMLDSLPVQLLWHFATYELTPETDRCLVRAELVRRLFGSGDTASSNIVDGPWRR